MAQETGNSTIETLSDAILGSMKHNYEKINTNNYVAPYTFNRNPNFESLPIAELHRVVYVDFLSEIEFLARTIANSDDGKNECIFFCLNDGKTSGVCKGMSEPIRRYYAHFNNTIASRVKCISGACFAILKTYGVPNPDSTLTYVSTQVYFRGSNECVNFDFNVVPESFTQKE